MSNPWDCVCEFLRAQSANLANVMQSLSNQNTISDLDTTSDVSLQSPSTLSPMHVFLLVLLAIWGFLFLNRKRGAEEQKPRNTSDESSSSGSGSGGRPGGGGALF
eukprot:GEMP01040569.1.p1 GENE.GEMP01040569.1~~GEMP01040569.1.p1  ORF type:complete len:105 (+),score=21.80 GEMP01040569.1:116-430(+)